MKPYNSATIQDSEYEKLVIQTHLLSIQLYFANKHEEELNGIKIIMQSSFGDKSNK